MRKTIDVGLQVAEVAFVLLFLYVVAQWLFADSLTDNNVAAEMAAVRPAQTATYSPTATAQVAAASVAPSATSSPLRARPTAARTPGAAPQGGAVEAADDTPSAATWADRDPLPGQRFRAGPTATATITASATVTATATPADPGDVAATPTDVVETNPLLPTEIRIPRIKLDARVREVTVRLDTWEWEVADFMAGHHTGTANPGETGNVVIAGHRDIPRLGLYEPRQVEERRRYLRAQRARHVSLRGPHDQDRQAHRHRSDGPHHRPAPDADHLHARQNRQPSLGYYRRPRYKIRFHGFRTLGACAGDQAPGAAPPRVTSAGRGESLTRSFV